jgi:sec-independent protein translocase protein TatA
MGSLGMQEIIVIFVLALIIFGPRKLPDLGKSLGRGMAEFKKASNELKQTWEDEVRLDKEKQDMAEILKDSSDWKRSLEEEVRLDSESRSDTPVDSKETPAVDSKETPAVDSKEIQ